MTELRVRPTDKQKLVIRAAKNPLFRYILTGGAMSTAKSYGLAIIFLNMAMQFAGSRYAVFRRNMPALKRTTYQTFRKVARAMGLVEGQHFKVNRQDMMWEFLNGAQVWFVELDETKDPDFDKVKGMELTAAGVDEANEVVEEAFTILGSRVGRENTNGEPQFVLLTCNPTDNWIKEKFYDPWVKDKLQPPYLFIPSLPEDNPHNSAQYLKALHDMPLQFRRRYVEGNWDYVDDSNALFPNRIIERAMSETTSKGERFIGVDVAREGQDRNVFALIENNILVDLYEPDIDTGEDEAILYQVADELIRYMKRHEVGYQNVTIDAVGLGAGVLDICRKRGYLIRPFKSGSPGEKDRVGNPLYDMLRSEQYWKVARAMENGDLKIWRGVPNFDELRKDLLAHNVEITDKTVKVESKKDIKKRLQRSPDFSDALVMAYRTTVAPKADIVTAVGSYDEYLDDDD